MRFAEEVVVTSFVPTWRSLLVGALESRGLSQTEIARLVGISQSAVSKYLTGRHGPDARLADEPRLLETVERVATGLANRTLSPFEALSEAETLVRAFENRGPICAIHEAEEPSLEGLGCDLCVQAGASQLVPEQAVLTDLRAAIRILENTPQLAHLLPHVGTNVARAVAGAKDVDAIAAIPGGLFAMRGLVKAPAPPEFGVSRHVAEVLLAVMRHDPHRMACLNLAPSLALLEKAREARLRVVETSPDIERQPRSLRFEGEVPDLFHHGGAFGVEPQAYFVGPDARSLAMRVRALVMEASASH